METVLNFWFEELSPKDWWVKSDELDKRIRDSFLDLHNQAAKGELIDWREIAEGRLAEIILLDQFSRNIYRDDKKAFLYDALALNLAKEAVQTGDDKKLSIEKRAFIYLPYMHSESLDDHGVAVKLFSQEGLESNLEFELAHKIIIEKFGRYPHRNKILGRTSTPEEIEFLKQPGSSF